MGVPVMDWSVHSDASRPGRRTALLLDVPVDPAGLSVVARNLIAHYRANAADLPAETAGDIDLRFLERMLDTDQQRHPVPLSTARPMGERLQGCCRDHTLLCVGVLRAHGIAARSRVGFAGYFIDGYHLDHVVVEYRDGDRWRRFDPEVDPEWNLLPDPHDLVSGEAADERGFRTAAQAYRAWRAGEADASTYGVAPGSPIGGAFFVAGEVLYELAHRYGDETLLWDVWGAIPGPDDALDQELLTLLDEVSAMLIAADDGDEEVERTLHAWYHADDRLHPGDVVTRISPLGGPPVQDRLRRPDGDT